MGGLCNGSFIIRSTPSLNRPGVLLALKPYTSLPSISDLCHRRLLVSYILCESRPCRYSSTLIALRSLQNPVKIAIRSRKGLWRPLLPSLNELRIRVGHVHSEWSTDSLEYVSITSTSLPTVASNAKSAMLCTVAIQQTHTLKIKVSCSQLSISRTGH